MQSVSISQNLCLLAAVLLTRCHVPLELLKIIMNNEHVILLLANYVF